MKLTIKILIGFLLLSYACDSRKDIEFNSKKWQIEKDLEYFPYRNLMINYIVENNLFAGFQYERLVDSLGIPNNVRPRNDNEIYYLIENDYGWDIDPIYTKYLILTLNNDSSVINSKVYEWKK